MSFSSTTQQSGVNASVVATLGGLALKNELLLRGNLLHQHFLKLKQKLAKKEASGLLPTIQINLLMAFRQPPGIWCSFSPSHEVDELFKTPSPGLHISQRLLEASSSNQHMWSLIPWLLQTRADAHLAQPTFSEIFCKIPQKQGVLPPSGLKSVAS